jgi:Protein of unknown function (DUF4232)
MSDVWFDRGRWLIGLLVVAGFTVSCVAAAPSSSSSQPTILGGTASLSASASATPSTTALGEVAWVDRPVAPFVEPTAVPLPTDARPCQPSDLTIRVGDFGAGLGNLNLPVDFLNHSDSSCVLVGEPTLEGVKANGSLVPLRVTAGSYFGDPGPPSNIGPGQVAALNISGVSGCSVGTFYPTFHLGLPGGGTVEFPTKNFPVGCGVWVSQFGVPADAVPATDTPLSELTAQITAPPTAKAGTTLTYSVTLSNTTGAAYSLSPCPAYTEFVGTGSTTWVATVLNYELNCDATPAIPARGSVTFQMRLALPAEQPAGSGKFGWDLQGDSGPWANAQLEILPAGG